ncbi:MAG: 23S rRNA (uracil(1939)-C(5))-methyltransferase RlmD [Acidobacteria bacterium]|nr:23S rRNA (uracil(1939)-C(5))-methyltransferase RlmD [Acidobacteriota bacterium]
MQLAIEKLIYGGDGLARLPADERGPGKAVFLPFVLGGEKVEADLVEEKSGFARARATVILDASPHRVAPACPYFTRCGGCHYQHASYEHQLEAKTAILRETLRRTARLEWPGEIRVHSAQPFEYRNRARLAVRGGRDFALGYHKHGTHDLLAVEHCPISSPLINRAITALWDLGRADQVGRAVFEVEFFADAGDAQLLAEVSVLTEQEGAGREYLAEFAGWLREHLPAIAGVAVFRKSREGPLVHMEFPEKLEAKMGADSLIYRTASAQYQVSAGSFFQTNRFLVDRLADLVTAGRTGALALDLYAGVGLFSLLLSQNFREVTAVETAPFAHHDLRKNSPSNVTAVRSTADRFLASRSEGARYELIVVDPPRTGLGEKVARAVGQLAAPRMTYVSCDPATLSRDLQFLPDR